MGAEEQQLCTRSCCWASKRRSVSQTGLYRISGCDKTVRELKEKFLRGKTIPSLSKVDDIHAICGLLKDFLRSLKEPLLTFRLNKTFMEAAGKGLLSDSSSSSPGLGGHGFGCRVSSRALVLAAAMRQKMLGSVSCPSTAGYQVITVARGVSGFLVSQAVIAVRGLLQLCLCHH